MLDGILDLLGLRRKRRIDMDGWQAYDGEGLADLPRGYDYGGHFAITVDGQVSGISFDVFVDDIDSKYPRSDIFLSHNTEKFYRYEPSGGVVDR